VAAAGEPQGVGPTTHMRAFALYLNGKKLGTAGVGDHGVLSANITWVRRRNEPVSTTRGADAEEIGVDLGGLNSDTDEHLHWREQPLRLGDEVCIRVVETESVDPPRRRQRRNRTQERRQQKSYVRQMAKKFGWTVVVPQR
jgi:hypothetical protein